MRRAIAVAIVFLTVTLSCRTSPARDSPRGSGGLPGQTPEETVRGFLAAAKALDLDGMIDRYAVDSYAEGYDLRAIALDIKMLTLRGGVLPKEYPAYRKANGYTRRAVAANASAAFLLALSGSRQSWSRGVHVLDAAQVDALLRELNPDRAKELQVLYVRNAVAAPHRKELQDNFDGQARQLGASSAAERVALIGVDGDVLVVPFRLLKYPTGWQIERMDSAINDLLGPALMSEKEFLERFPE